MTATLSRSRRAGALVLVTLSFCGLATVALANETTTYKYDALGRLIETNATGTVNNGLNTQTSLDPAGNRQNYAVTGATGGPSSSAIVVVPLNGYTVIPIGVSNFGL